MVAGYLLAQLDDAEDAAQIAFVWLIEHRPEGNVGGWLFTVAKHELFDRLRDLKREQRAPAADEAASADVDERLHAGHVLGLLREMKAQQRRCLALHAFGFSYDEIMRADRPVLHGSIAI